MKQMKTEYQSLLLALLLHTSMEGKEITEEKEFNLQVSSDLL